MTAIDAPPPTSDEVAARIKDSVWTLICKGKMDAAVVLLEANVDEFDKAYRLEMIGITPDAEEPEQTRPTEEASTCVSLLHAMADCHEAIIAGELTAEPCDWCKVHPPVNTYGADAIEPETSPAGTKVYRITEATAKARPALIAS